MGKHESQVLQLTKRAAAVRCRQLLDELHLLVASFPDLRDAFDPDELPLAFIMRRDSQSTEPDGTPLTLTSRRAGHAASRRPTASDTPHRRGHRKQMSGE